MDLELADTDDLIEELFSRYDHACFCGLKDDADTDLVEPFWQGNPYTVIGLAHEIIHHALAESHTPD